jgi:NAD(P)H-flavin reductase
MVSNIRATQNAQVLDELYSGIGRIAKRFEHYLPELLTDVDNVAHIFMCGPPVMTGELAKRMDHLSVPKDKYTIM